MSEKQKQQTLRERVENCLSAREGAPTWFHFCFSSLLFTAFYFNEDYIFVLVRWDDVALKRQNVILNTDAAL